MLVMLPRHQVEIGSCCIYSSSQHGTVSHATCEQVEAAAPGISSGVNCIINPQAVKRQAWQEFTLGPSLSHRHNLALCVRVSDTTLLASPPGVICVKMLSRRFWLAAAFKETPSSLTRACVFAASCFHFLSHFCVFFLMGGCWAAVGSNMRCCCWRFFFFFFYCIRVHFYKTSCQTHTIL